MIADWQTDTIFFSDRLEKEYPDSFKRIAEVLQSFNIVPKYLPQTKDIWARDFMPIQVNDNKFVEYRYDPDYLQGKEAGRRDLKTYPDIVCDSLDLPTTKTDIILDGGNVVKSSDAIILTDKVVTENKRTYNEKQLLDKLRNLFEVDKVVLIPWDDVCEFGHADGMLRFMDNDTVLISGFYETADLRFKEMILNSLRQSGLKHEWLRCSGKKEKEENIAYINFLQTGELILVPKLNRGEDNQALEKIGEFYPEYAEQGRIAQVDIAEIFRKEGALNCISWTIKGGKLWN